MSIRICETRHLRHCCAAALRRVGDHRGERSGTTNLSKCQPLTCGEAKHDECPTAPAKHFSRALTADTPQQTQADTRPPAGIRIGAVPCHVACHTESAGFTYAHVAGHSHVRWHSCESGHGYAAPGSHLVHGQTSASHQTPHDTVARVTAGDRLHCGLDHETSEIHSCAGGSTPHQVHMSELVQPPPATVAVLQVHDARNMMENDMDTDTCVQPVCPAS